MSQKLTIVDFDEQLHINFLEEIFKADCEMLGKKRKIGFERDLALQTFKDFEPDNRKILTVENIPVAFAIYFISSNNKFKQLQDGDGVLALMGVHPDFRQKGYGSMVLEHVLQFFNDKHCSQGWLSVNKNNIKAQNLYKKFGFKNTEEVSWGDSSWWMLPLKK